MFDDHHHHSHEHGGGHDHVHHHGHDHGEPVDEAPLDAANQSLSDALRASFRVLKWIMVVVVVFFLGSGVFMVDERQVAVVSRFGAMEEGEARGPGFQWALPYPIDEVTRVSTAPETLTVEDFWLKLNEQDRNKPLDQLIARANSLDPATDGALLTADRAIMHALFKIQYKIPPNKAKDYVRNVVDRQQLVASVIKQAAVAEAARTTAEVVWREPDHLAQAVMARAQRYLEEELKSGIQLENVSIPKSHYPLQAATEFLAVNTAENRKRELINEAQSEREKKLNGMAGAAWEKINGEVEKLDQVKTDAERDEIIRKIGHLLATEATGEAGGRIKKAESQRETIVNNTIVEVSQFEAVREQYRRNPDLVRRQLGQYMREALFASKDVAKWILPEGEKNLVMWLNKDPKEIAEQEKARMEARTRGR